MGSLLKICWRDRTNAGLLSGTQHVNIIQAKKGEEGKGGKWDNGLTFTECVQNYHIQLNDQQMQAVQATEGPVLLLAVPGSGKTTVLVSRLGYMVYCRGITPESILTVT